jgi:hypothetical protein
VCDLCDLPDLTPEDYLEWVRDRLRGRCFLVQSVEGSADSAELSYTVGLTAHGLAELVVVGRRHADAVRLLQSWGDYVLDQSLVLPGERLGSGTLVMEAVEVERPEEHLLVAAALYGPGVRALQLAWADARGRWPWEPGHRARRAGQPLLGARAPWYCPEHRPDRLEVPPYLDGTS